MSEQSLSLKDIDVKAAKLLGVVVTFNCTVAVCFGLNFLFFLLIYIDHFVFGDTLADKIKSPFRRSFSHKRNEFDDTAEIKMEDFTTRQGRHNGNREDLTDGLYYEKDNDQINNTLKFEIDAEVSANAAVRAGSATGNAMTSITLDDDGLQRLLDEKFPRQNYHDYIMSFNFTGNKGNHTCFCPIKEFKDFDLIKVLPCGDFFHADCLDKQVKSGNRICHNCAADFTDFLIASEAQVEAHIGTQGEAQGEEVEMASASASVSTSASAEDLGHTEREAKNQADHETKSVRINAPSIKSVRTRTVTVNSPGSDFYNSYLNMDD